MVNEHQKETGSEGAPESKGRRRFLKSIFGLGSALETGSEASASPVRKKRPVRSSSEDAFFWADLKLGNIGFPSGLKVPTCRPGSVMKLITAACLLEEGAFNPNETIECTGVVRVDGGVYRCPVAHGRVSIERAIGLSCNSFFAKASKKIGPMSIVEYARLFGLNTPIVGYGAAKFPASPSSSTAEYALGLSNSLVPNALQLLRVSALIALAGNTPSFRNAGMLEDPDPPFSISLRDSTFERIRNGMILSAREGTAEKIDPERRLSIACKTGTVPHGKKFQSWVTGYFPYNSPKHAFCLYSASGTSHDSAVPKARKQLLGVEWPE